MPPFVIGAAASAPGGLSGIAALIVVVVFAFGGVIQNIFKHTCSSVRKSDSAAGSC